MLSKKIFGLLNDFSDSFLRLFDFSLLVYRGIVVCQRTTDVGAVFLEEKVGVISFAELSDLLLDCKSFRVFIKINIELFANELSIAFSVPVDCTVLLKLDLVFLGLNLLVSQY